METGTRNGTKPADDGGRGPNGRFQPGCRPGPGKRKGTPNKATVDAIELRKRIIASWDRVSGDKLLDQYARDDFPGYVKLVVGLLPVPPRPTGQELPATQQVHALQVNVASGEPAAGFGEQLLAKWLGPGERAGFIEQPGPDDQQAPASPDSQPPAADLDAGP